MLDKGRISPFQLAIILYPTVLASGFILLPSSSAEYAKNDFWMTGLFSMITGYLSVYTAIKLHQLYPKQTLSQYSEKVIGKIPGKLVALFITFHLLSSAGIIARHYAEFVKGNVLFKTPITIIIVLLLFLAAFAVRGGVEMIARCGLVLTPIFILPMFILLLLIPDLHVKYVFPILGGGIAPVLKGAIGPMSFATQLFLISFFLPSINGVEKAKKWALLSLLSIMLSMVFINLITLLLLGPDTNGKTYPLLTAFRYISVADFFENLEALLLTMWIAGNFMKITVFYYATALSLGYIFKLSDYRVIVFPLGLLILACSMWGFPDYITLGMYTKITAPFDIGLNLMLLPLLLLGIAGIRKLTARK